MGRHFVESAQMKNSRLKPVKGFLAGLTVLLAQASNAIEVEKVSGPEADDSAGYFADLGWRTSAGVANAWEAAIEIFESNPKADIEFLVHGKDMRLFIDGATRRKPHIVELSEKLAANGAKFKVCDHALSFKGVTLEHFPAHFGTVDYVPDRVTELRSKGFADLHKPPQ